MERLSKTIKNIQITIQELVKKVKSISDESGGTTIWGTITGTLADQTDLNTALTSKAPIVHNQAFTTITGTATVTQIPALDVAKITTGIFPIARIPTGVTATTVSLGNHTHDIAALLKAFPGYNATATQTLKNVTGTLQWVTDI